MDEATLMHKLRLLEALHAGGATDGEKEAAGLARDRLLKRLARLEKEDPPIEFRLSLADSWSRRLFTAICRRYNLAPYRYHGQRRTTLMVRVPKSFMNDTLWPEYESFSDVLNSYLSEVTDRVISTVLEQKPQDAEMREEPKQLTFGAG